MENREISGLPESDNPQEQRDTAKERIKGLLREIERKLDERADTQFGHPNERKNIYRSLGTIQQYLERLVEKHFPD